MDRYLALMQMDGMVRAVTHQENTVKSLKTVDRVSHVSITYNQFPSCLIFDRLQVV